MLTKSKALIFVAASFMSLACEASTSITLDAKANCIPNASTTANTPYLKFQLDPGRYVFSLINNTMSCQRGSLVNGCNINAVAMSGGNATAHWGTTVTATPIVIDSTTSAYMASISDDNCNDNTGQVTILAEKAS